MIRNYVVDFNLPTDADLFVHHGANITARNEREASRLFREKFPTAKIRRVFQGVVILYGAPYANWDISKGAECSPADEQPSTAGGASPCALSR